MNFVQFWGGRSATADAALDASVAEMLWQEVEKRRKNAWLRKVGVVARIFAYAYFFLVLFCFMPQGLSEGWLTTRPFSQLTLGDIFAALVWTLIGAKLIHALFNPNPRPDFREYWGWGGVTLIVLAAIGGGAVYMQTQPDYRAQSDRSGAESAQVEALSPDYRAQSDRSGAQSTQVEALSLHKTYAPGTVLPPDSPFAGWRVMER
jgi:hypothetical protein